MTEKLRGELKKLRSDAIDAEMQHQQALSAVTEQHLLELSAQRGDVDAGLGRCVCVFVVGCVSVCVCVCACD